MNGIVQTEKASLINTMAAKYNMEPKAFEMTVRSTVMPTNHTNEQFAAFLMVANEYNLNPILSQIYAFPSKGGIKPIVSVDGWNTLINSNPNFDGMTFVDNTNEKGEIVSITCKMYRKDRSHPVEVTEYMKECKRDTQPWNQWPARMLRHKATIQAARYAFSFAGIYDQDEGERIVEAEEIREVHEIAYTEVEKIEFDRLFNGDDSLAFWLFWQSLNDKARIEIFNSFPAKIRGSDIPGKTELKDKVRKMEAEGNDIFSNYCEQAIDCIATEDAEGLAEIKHEMRIEGWIMLVDGLSPEAKHTVDQMIQEDNS